MALLFRRRQRLTHANEFQRVYDARVSKRAGPLVVYLLPNDGACHRLGLSVGRRVGNAVTRNAVKRRLRESFRLIQHDLPCLDQSHYDIVVNTRPHDPIPLAEHQRHLAGAVAAAHQVWARRRRRQA